MMFRCVAAIPNAGGNCIEHFYPDTPEGYASAEAFAQQYNRDGWGVYDCVSPLREERRAKDAVAQIVGLHVDLDARNMKESKEQIVETICDKLKPFGIVSLVNDSGRGVHLYSIFNEPIEAGTPEAERAERALRRLVLHLNADRAPTHFAALMRRVGTMNSKAGGGLCQTILDTGARCKLFDIEAYLDLVDGKEELFAPQENVEAANRAQFDGAPVEVEARLAAMKYEDTNGLGVNATCCAVIPALIWKAWPPADIHKLVLDAVMQMAERDGLNWDRAAEERQTNERIAAAYHNLFEKEYDSSTGVIPVWLPMEFHEQWANILSDGRRPTIMRNGSGWHVRRVKETGEKTNGDTGNGSAHQENAEKEEAQASRAPFVLRPFVPFNPAMLPPRQFLFGKHYQRRTVGGTVAPGGTGKSSLQMVESVSMATGRNLLGEEPRERVRTWYHNGEDNMDELNRRLASICQYYDIPLDELPGWFFMTSGNEVPLRVAQGYSNLDVNHRLIRCIAEAIGDNGIDVATLDPLVTLHGVPENDTGKMDTVVRIFAKMADAQNCAIELSHHTRKLLAGSTDDYSVDDMRGAGSMKDAMRAVRMLNFMSKADAEGAGIAELERTSYFRVDRAKANNAPPAKAATWRKFVNVDLPNSDEVGVIVPWEFPGQDAPPTPEKAEAERKAEHIFMELLARFTLAGRFVNDGSGPSNAPSMFAKEREAKLAKVGKSALADAMRRLFEKQKIRNECYERSGRQAFKIVAA
jgi:RecA-family ATPase